jgi:hypothetical protein
MEDTPNYRVVLVAEAPSASLTESQFRTQALARVWAASTNYLADTSVAHRPAHSRQGVEVAAITNYTVQVWDLALSSKAKLLGKFLLVAEAETPEACLTELQSKLAELEAEAYDADPSRFTNAQIESFQQLEAAA